MNALLQGLVVVGVLLSAVVSFVGGYAVYRNAKRTRRVRRADRLGEPGGGLYPTGTGEVMWVAPQDPRTKDAAEALDVNSSGPSISTTWTEFSNMESPDRPGPGDVPRGFRGEDLTDREMDEWLREHGLKGYE